MPKPGQKAYICKPCGVNEHQAMNGYVLPQGSLQNGFRPYLENYYDLKDLIETLQGALKECEGAEYSVVSINTHIFGNEAEVSLDVMAYYKETAELKAERLAKDRELANVKVDKTKQARYKEYLKLKQEFEGGS